MIKNKCELCGKEIVNGDGKFSVNEQYAFCSWEHAAEYEIVQHLNENAKEEN